MPIKEKVDKKDLILYEIIRHPVLLGEFLENFDLPQGSDKWEFSWYQKEFICDFNQFVSVCCARAVGKTVSLVHMLIWVLINNLFPKDYAVYTVPNKVHIDPVWTGLTRMFRTHPILRQFTHSRTGINSSSYNIKLNNGMVLDCRIAGTTGTGANVVGMHSPFEVVDEASFYPWGTWIELQPTLNDWQRGSRLIVAGVPVGLRDNNVLYYTDIVDDIFTKHRISAFENPRFSKEAEERAAIKYGGRDTEDYVHHVLGEHGTASYAVFDRGLMLMKQFPVYVPKIDGIKMDNLSDYISRIDIIPLIDKQVDYKIMGIDLGYTAPTAIHIMYSSRGIIRHHARVELNKVPYPIQKQLIDRIDDRFGRFEVIGIDAGGPGQPVIQDLLEGDAFIHKDYRKRLIPVNFGEWIILGISQDDEEIKAKVKPFSVSLLQEYSNSHRIEYSTMDLDMITELERMTYTKNTRGDVVYRTLTPAGGQRGDDHHTAALLAAMIAHYELKDATNLRPKAKRLAGFSWLMRG